MRGLISKDESIKTSAVYVGYLVLKILRDSKADRVSLFEVAKSLRGHGIAHTRPLMFGLMFLHNAGLVDFAEPYIYLTDAPRSPQQ